MKVLSVYLQSSPDSRTLIGRIAEDQNKIYFQYAPEFLNHPVWLSPYKLPLQSEMFEFKDRDFGPIFGLFNDSLPDGWGILLMDRYLRKQGIDIDTFTILDRLSFLGSSTMGALIYEPAMEHEAYERAVDLQNLAKYARKILKGDDTRILPEVLKMGGSPQGSRPKALVGRKGHKLLVGADDLPDGYEHWLVKFPGKGDFSDAGKIERAYSLMAENAGILMPETCLFKGESGDAYFGIQRFDRKNNQRFHVHSLGGLIHSNFRIPECDYQVFIRVISNLTKRQEDVERGFRQMVFNIISNNRDDHVKNFAFMIGQDGEWTLSPAYDLMYSGGPGGEHSMSICGEGRNPGIKEVKQTGADAGIKTSRIKAIVDQVISAARQWEDDAAQSNVSERSKNIIQKKINQNLNRFN